MVPSRLEEERLQVQQNLDAERSYDERNETGQHATPQELARAIVRGGLPFVEDEENVRFLDPAVGTGAFYSALLSELDHLPAYAHGIEIDSRFVQAGRELWEKKGLEITQADFTRVMPNIGQRVNFLVTNPPYVRHHHLDKQQKAHLQSEVERRIGRKISGLAGLYVYFLLLSHTWMREGGVAAWLIPSEWMEVNYGEVLREYLTQDVTALRLHTFDAANVQFGDALVSSSVVYFRKCEPKPDNEVRLTSGSLSAPEIDFSVPLDHLREQPKWSSVIKYEGQAAGGFRHAVGDLLNISRGIATGRNKYFIRRREEWEQIGVPEEFRKPILPSGRHLEGRIIEADDNGYPKVDPILEVLDCTLREEEIRNRYPALWTYLTNEEADKARDSYLAQRRSPWYAQEQRDSAPLICTYMGRSDDGESPFKVFVNRSRAIAKNSLHLAYPKRALSRVLEGDPERIIEIAELLEETAAEWYRYHGRVYGGGLHKMEPRELESLPADRLADQLKIESDGDVQMNLI